MFKNVAIDVDIDFVVATQKNDNNNNNNNNHSDMGLCRMDSIHHEHYRFLNPYFFLS